MKKKISSDVPIAQIPVIHADPADGLDLQQVYLRQEGGLRNLPPETNTKSVGQIVRENSLTFFNLVFLLLGLCLLFVGSFKNMAFLGVAVCNTLIGIFQEIRAKKAVDKLTLVAAGTLSAIRGGEKVCVRTDLLVRDDIVEFTPGDQICADAIVRQGQIQVNESLLTGEADAIKKEVGAELKSGSFVLSGHCLAQLTKVGAESYAAKLSAEAKQNMKTAKSEMMRSLTRLITVVGIILIPMGILLFLRQIRDVEIAPAVESTVAALIGMIPEGLYLLTSVAIAVSSLKLARKRVLVQDMNCIETLAHVDVLCVDKTGTITEPAMEVTELYPLPSDRYGHEDIEKILAAFYYGQETDNETAAAMCRQFALESDWKAVERIDFTSATKWTAADFGEHGRYIVGAPEFILAEAYESIRELVESWAQRGCRALLLAAYEEQFAEKLNPGSVTPIALIYLSNSIRPDAPDTFRYFAAQGVSIRVISGDNPLTVSEVASRAGIENADRYVDATSLSCRADYVEAVKNYTVFGRVTPEQKRHLIHAFQEQGHTVAMTGDGVNDVLALKDSDCGIAMASGAQAASQISRIVLLDSQFSAMPQIVAEGRRVINNIQRAAALFLVKNIFSLCLALILLFVDMPYPLQPIQLSLISTLTIGIPSFFLALEPNYAIVRGKFMRNVIRRAMAGGLTNVILVLLAMLCTKLFHLPVAELETMSLWILATVGFVTLYHVSVPFTKLRIAVFAVTITAMLVCLLFMPGFFELTALSGKSILILVLLLAVSPSLMYVFRLIFDRKMEKKDQKAA